MYYYMFNNTYKNLGLLTTGIFTVGTAIYYYYYGGSSPFSTEKQVEVAVTETDSDN